MFSPETRLHLQSAFIDFLSFGNDVFGFVNFRTILGCHVCCNWWNTFSPASFHPSFIKRYTVVNGKTTLTIDECCNLALATLIVRRCSGCKNIFYSLFVFNKTLASFIIRPSDSRDDHLLVWAIAANSLDSFCCWNLLQTNFLFPDQSGGRPLDVF